VTIDFTAENTEGTVTIVASTSELSSDSIEIKVTVPKKPVKINLTANPTYMTADTNSTSEITATIVDADGETATKATNVITFSVSGPGTLSAITSTAPTNCIATITLTSNGTPETITVTASATDLEPGVVNVFTGGKISLSASRFSVPVNETSEVTVTTKDVDGVPINYEGTINLEISPNPDGAGIFENDLNTIEVDFEGSTSSNTDPITLTASSEGTIKITATDQAGILDEGSIELTITEELVPDHIAVTANPSIIFIKAGGEETSTITARVKTADDITTVISYNESVLFTRTGVGNLSYSDTMFKDGKAIAILDPLETAGTATITVYSPSLPNPSSTINITVKPITLILVDASVKYKLGHKIITFNIEIDGPILNLDSMKIVWGSGSELNNIEIKSPSTTGIYETIMSGSESSSYTEYTEDNINKDLSPGESTIRLTFSQNMGGIRLVVTFYTNYEGYELTYELIIVE
jgi:hypothetical protein